MSCWLIIGLLSSHPLGATVGACRLMEPGLLQRSCSSDLFRCRTGVGQLTRRDPGVL